MKQSRNLKFDYLVASQAQKHLTVNDALARIDALTQLVVSPASSALNDGTVKLADNGSDLEIGLNGGVQVLSAEEGWQAYFVEDQSQRVFDGTAWQKKDKNNENFLCKQFEFDFAKPEAIIIAEKSVVFGVTALVLEDLQGEGVKSWQMGVDGDLMRYGSGLWLGKNGWAKGLTGTPLTYWNDTILQFTGNGGAIESGKLAVYLYALELAIPTQV